MVVFFLVTLFQTLSLPPGLSMEKAPHAASLAHGQFAVVRLNVHADAIRAKVAWTNISNLPSQLQFRLTDVSSQLKNSKRHALVALDHDGERWILHKANVTAFGVPNTVRRFAALVEIERFRDALYTLIATNNISPIADLLDARLPIVQQAAVEILTWHARLESLSIELIDSLGHFLINGAGPRAIFSKRLRLMEQLGRDNTADWLTEVISTKLPAHLRGQAIAIMGKYLTNKSKAWLLQCAVSQGPVIATQCRRWLGTGEK